MKIEAGGFEGKPAMIQQAADVRFRVANQVLVLKVQYLAGQDRVPVVHERQIAAIVAPQIVEGVAEGLALGKVLFEGAETAIHGMAAGVDDGRARQHGVDQTDMAEVIGQLVGEVFPPRAQRRGFLADSGRRVR